MNCEQIAEVLPDYFLGTLRGEQARQVEDHLEHCAACCDEVVVWKKLSLIPSEQPSPESRARFEAVLDAFPSASVPQWSAGFASAKPSSSWITTIQWFRSPLGAIAWSLALLVIGIFIGTRFGDTKSSHSQELAALHSELSNMRQLVVLSMLQQQSAGERLQGVT